VYIHNTTLHEYVNLKGQEWHNSGIGTLVSDCLKICVLLRKSSSSNFLVEEPVVAVWIPAQEITGHCLNDVSGDIA